MATRVEGLASLRRKLAALPEASQAAVRKALETGAGEIVAMAKRLVPRDSGDLQNSIGWTWGDAPKGSIALASGGSGEMRITVYAGNDEAFYARWVEFGTASAAAHPFFFPSYRALRKRVRGRVERGVRKALKAVAAS